MKLPAVLYPNILIKNLYLDGLNCNDVAQKLRAIKEGLYPWLQQDDMKPYVEPIKNDIEWIIPELEDLSARLGAAAIALEQGKTAEESYELYNRLRPRYAEIDYDLSEIDNR